MQKCVKTLADVIALAEFAHRNQYDKAGMAYIEHPKRVMSNVQAEGAMPYVQMAAALHDVTEDTPFTPAMLLALGVPEAAVNIVALLDRNHSKLQYEIELALHHKGQIPIPDFYDSPDTYYYYRIRQNPGAVQVKLADIGDNLQPWRLAYLPEATQDRLRAKYAKAIDLLTKD
mgnify:CR=1 FL=1